MKSFTLKSLICLGLMISVQTQGKTSCEAAKKHPKCPLDLCKTSDQAAIDTFTHKLLAKKSCAQAVSAVRNCGAIQLWLDAGAGGFNQYLIKFTSLCDKDGAVSAETKAKVKNTTDACIKKEFAENSDGEGGSFGALIAQTCNAEALLELL